MNPPPTDEYRFLVEHGCYSRTEIERIREKALPKVGAKGSIVVLEPDEVCPYYTIHLPIFIHGAYVFHLTMVCEDPSMLKVSEDVFAILSTYVEAICIEFWNKHLEAESPCHKALIRIIEQTSMTDQYVKTQLGNTVIPATRFFRLLRYPIAPDLSWEKSRAALKNASALFPGYCYPFMYRGDLLVLACSPTNTLAGVSLHRVLTLTTEFMLKPYGLVCALSQPFERIEDIHLAYRQTAQALSKQAMLQAQYPEGYDGEGAFPVVPFEHTLQYSLLDRDTDEDLISSAFANSVIDLVSQEDKAQGTDLTGLLWEFLCSKCNATETAKKLNLHRNTVVYHINKFEKRFDLLLELPMVRQRLFLDFVHHFSRPGA